MSQRPGQASHSKAHRIEADGRVMATHQLGCLIDSADWAGEAAVALAAREDFELAPGRWPMNGLAPDSALGSQVVAEAHCLLKAMKQQPGEEKGTRRYLHRLFSHRSVPELRRVAGNTMPRKATPDV